MNLFKNNQSVKTTEVNELVAKLVSSATSLAKGKYDLVNAIKRVIETDEGLKALTVAAQTMQNENDLSVSKKNKHDSVKEYLDFLESQGSAILELWAQGSYKTNSKVELKASKALEHMNKGYSGALDGKCRFPSNIRALRENLNKLTMTKKDEKTNVYKDLEIGEESGVFEIVIKKKQIKQRQVTPPVNPELNGGGDNDNDPIEPKTKTVNKGDMPYSSVLANTLQLDEDNRKRLIKALLNDAEFTKALNAEISLTKLDASDLIAPVPNKVTGIKAKESA